MIDREENRVIVQTLFLCGWLRVCESNLQCPFLNKQRLYNRSPHRTVTPAVCVASTVLHLLFFFSQIVRQSTFYAIKLTTSLKVSSGMPGVSAGGGGGLEQLWQLWPAWQLQVMDPAWPSSSLSAPCIIKMGLFELTLHWVSLPPFLCTPLR